MKLNFNLNEKAPSGRLYNPKNFILKMNEQIKRGTFFFEYSGKYSSMEVNVKNIMGFVEECSIHENGDVFFKVTPNIEQDNKMLNVIDECSLCATGFTDKKGNTIINNIVCLRPSPMYGLIFEMDSEENNE